MNRVVKAVAPGRRVLLLVDIEGSPACRNGAASQLGTPEWAVACRELTRDVDVVAKAFFDAGATDVRIQDYHRTGFNIFRYNIDRRAVLRQGYKAGPVPGIGRLPPADTLAMIGFHASSGSPGFLPHTLTSRFARVTIDGRPLCEAELFAGAIAAAQTSGGPAVRARLFSGCPVACREASGVMPGISIIQSIKLDPSDPHGRERLAEWRAALAAAARESLAAPGAEPPGGNGPFRIEVEMRDGASAASAVAARWGLECSGSTVSFTAPNRLCVFQRLTDIAYLSPWMKPAISLLLRLADMRGRRALDAASAMAHP
ncbi:MAG TPA: M55 family metallopeptidase [Candidatus Ozemobacteraceae bacterium]|nr:M55 family metallopeptidase [Candidatus Ozemobacteraceae bacterium]HQG27311.1 M55 family metallopeptidase [Candidatus Ozemobacteraceae bacterium]